MSQKIEKTRSSEIVNLMKCELQLFSYVFWKCQIDFFWQNIWVSQFYLRSVESMILKRRDPITDTVNLYFPCWLLFKSYVLQIWLRTSTMLEYLLIIRWIDLQMYIYFRLKFCMGYLYIYYIGIIVHSRNDIIMYLCSF